MTDADVNSETKTEPDVENKKENEEIHAHLIGKGKFVLWKQFLFLLKNFNQDWCFFPRKSIGQIYWEKFLRFLALIFFFYNKTFSSGLQTFIVFWQTLKKVDYPQQLQFVLFLRNWNLSLKASSHGLSVAFLFDYSLIIAKN